MLKISNTLTHYVFYVLLSTLFGVAQFFVNGAIHKGFPHIRGEVGQTKVDKFGHEERRWLANCGRLHGKTL